uniref:Neutral ceramidase n=1 Tax=Globisporangium ultimum (strain ATCC 200006 / CBS 805.95 / DAOM BR144) TaxID=431595 RepID=K3WW18_GLOUD
MHAQEYRIGTGKGDITGPAAEIVMMGYGDPEQQTAGILNRLHARAYLIEDTNTKERVLIVNCDLQAVFQLVHQEVIQQLQSKYNGIYTEQNVVLHATHTHAGPGGSSAYVLYDFCILGFVNETFDAIVSGILAAIDEAHNSLAPGTIRFSKGEIKDGGKNRSPEAYNANPHEERTKYASDHDTDLRLLQFRNASDTLIGLLAFYPVHPTSLTKKNKLISGDNKGYAEFLLENQFPSLTAGIGISNAGDVSPNLIDNGDGTFQGEGATDLESAEIIGQRQADKVVELLNAPSELVTGSVLGRLSYVDFSNVTLHNKRPTEQEPYAHRTCPGLLGQNFGAGTEDGRAFPNLREGDLTPNTIFRSLSHLVKATPDWLQQCHTTNKVPMLVTGLMAPYKWTPEILPVQVIKIGQLALAVTNFEVTTMAGRRLRETLHNTLGHVGVKEVEVAAMSNAYAQYITTKEEYALQHYEGASTLFGPNQLEALQQEMARVAASVANPKLQVARGPLPVQFDRKSLYSFQPPVIMDSAGWSKHFGDVRVDAAPVYSPDSVVSVAFYGGHPRNQFPQVHSFCDIEVETHNGKFATLLTDSHWDVRFRWHRTGLTESTSVCEWHLRGGRSSSLLGTGRYRIRHRGFYKHLMGAVHAYEGVSSSFFVGAQASATMNETTVCLE